MKKLIGVLGMVALMSMGIAETASAQFGGFGAVPQRQVSARAKGAIIGGGLGAAAGAIINKRDPVMGGVVGAVIGAGAGYVVGNNEDKIRRENAYYYQNNNNRGNYNRQKYYRQKQYRQQRVYNDYRY